MKDILRNFREYPPALSEWVALLISLACLVYYWAN